MRILHQHDASSAVAPVTVVIPVYNYSQYVRECLESVRLQTFPDLSLIVVDDCSTDDSVLVILDWLKANTSRFASVQFLQNEENLGVSSSRNIGFTESVSPYIFPLDPDNLLYPVCIARHYQALKNSHAAFAFSYIEEFPEENWQHDGLIGVGNWEPGRLKYGNWIDAMSLIRRASWMKYGGYTATEPQGWEDYDLWCKFAENNETGIHLQQILSRYRVHSKSLLRTVTNSNQSGQELRARFKAVYPMLFGG